MVEIEDLSARWPMTEKTLTIENDKRKLMLNNNNI